MTYYPKDEPWTCPECGGSFYGDLIEGRKCPGDDCRYVIASEDDDELTADGVNNNVLTSAQMAAEITRLEAENAELRRENEVYAQYWKLTEDARGAQHYAADCLLEHFNADGSLKGEGLWRAKGIFDWIQKFIAAERSIGDNLDWSKFRGASDAAIAKQAGKDQT